MIRVKYVGKKPFAVDNIARSGIVWNGHGDVQDCADGVARAVLAYPDQWVVADQEDAVRAAKEPMTIFLTPEGERLAFADADLKKNLEKMSADELRAYALRHYRKTFPPRMSTKRLLDEVEELIKGMDPLTF